MKIKDEQDREWSDLEDLSRTFVLYFQSLFSLSSPEGIDDCLADVPRRVTSSMNDQLLRNFTLEEVDTALTQIHPLKSPGSDGYSASFYQYHWSSVGPSVRAVVLRF